MKNLCTNLELLKISSLREIRHLQKNLKLIRNILNLANLGESSQLRMKFLIQKGKLTSKENLKLWNKLATSKNKF